MIKEGGNSLKPNIGDEVYFARILAPFGIYESLFMRCRTSKDEYVVICNKNGTHLLNEKDFDKIFNTKRECDEYLREQKTIHKNDKVYTE